MRFHPYDDWRIPRALSHTIPWNLKRSLFGTIFATPDLATSIIPIYRRTKSFNNAPTSPASKPELHQRAIRKSAATEAFPPPPKSSLDPESLFIPQYDDEDRQWGEKTLDDEEDIVGWGASASTVNVS